MAARRETESATRRSAFPRTHRLRRPGEFKNVYAGDRRRRAGPLLVWARPNDLGHCRLGLAIGRRVGGAVRRARLKRMVRETFRLMQHDLPGGYDIVVTAQAHDPLPLAEYQRLLSKALRKLHERWTKPINPGPQSDPPADQHSTG